jgi:preprotein translocase subunit SecG
MKLLLLIVHIVVAVGVIGLILLQTSKGGLGGGFGGADFYRSKRGAERVVFTATIVFTVIFFITSILNLLVR